MYTVPRHVRLQAGRGGYNADNTHPVVVAGTSRDFLLTVLPTEDCPDPSFAHCKQVHMAWHATPACMDQQKGEGGGRKISRIKDVRKLVTMWGGSWRGGEWDLPGSTHNTS